VREFESGMIRDEDRSKLDYEGFLSPLVIERFAQYMHKHRDTAHGWRESDNWQLGTTRAVWMKSGWRHFFDWWAAHRGLPSREGIEEAICGVMFNAMGYLNEILKERQRHGDRVSTERSHI
jgi:hypothetical protein